jgi:hypothetical protein
MLFLSGDLLPSGQVLKRVTFPFDFLLVVFGSVFKTGYPKITGFPIFVRGFVPKFFLLHAYEVQVKVSA